MDEIRKDEGLKGNEKIEEYIGMLQKEPSAEMLSVTLTTIRRRMREGGQFIVPVDMGKGNRLQIQVMQLDGASWLPAFTGFEEELKGKTAVMSTFMADIGQIFDMALSGDVAGVILNPWGVCPLFLVFVFSVLCRKRAEKWLYFNTIQSFL